MRFITFLLLFTLPLLAQPPGVMTGGARPANPQTILTASADTLLADPAERSSIASTAELKFKRGWKQIIKPSFTLRNEYYDVDGDVFGDVDFESPDEATHAELGLSYLQFTETGWSFFSKAELGFAAEDSSDLSEDPTFLTILGAGRKFRNGNTFGLGLITKRDVEENWRVFPVPNIELRFAEHWTFGGERGLTVKRDAGGSSRFGFGVDYLNSRFRTSAGQVLEYNAAPVYFQVEHDASEKLQLTGRLGVSVWGELELDDENGRGLDDEDLDPGFNAALQARWTF